MEGGHRLRLKLPGGAEFEAEGSAEFVYRERKDFLGALHGGPATDAGDLTQPIVDWNAITEQRGRNLQLRGKLPDGKSEKDACLVLLAAAQKILSLPKPTATQIAKWLRQSGYPIVRMDRAIQAGVAEGELLSSGSRRARRYELTASGRLRAYILAHQLSAAVTGRP